MKLIVGLGNPGRKYEGTRHNVGWEVISRLEKKYGGGPRRGRFQGETCDVTIEGEKVVLLCPQTFMNLSGASVQPARDFFKLDNTDLMIVCDDFNLPLGKLRIRVKGSSGGQKGLEDVIQRLGGDEFPRLRIGIGTPPENWDVADYVLSRFSPQERPEMDAATEKAAEALEVWIRLGIETCMNRYN